MPTTGFPTDADSSPEIGKVLCGWLLHCKAYVSVGVVVGCSLVFGLFARSWTAGHDGFRRRGPFRLAGYDALDLRRVVLASGLTGSPSLHIVLATLWLHAARTDIRAGFEALSWLTCRLAEPRRWAAFACSARNSLPR